MAPFQPMIAESPPPPMISATGYQCQPKGLLAPKKPAGMKSIVMKPQAMKRRDVGHDHAREERAEPLDADACLAARPSGVALTSLSWLSSPSLSGVAPRAGSWVAAARAASRAEAASFAARAASAMARASSRVCCRERCAHVGEGGRRHRQARRAEADEHDGQQRVGGGLAADADGLAERAPGVADLADQAQHGGVPRVLEAGDRAEQAVGGQRVLGEVVRADRGEVGVREHAVGQQRARRAPRP